MVSQSELKHLISNQIEAIGSGSATPASNYNILMENLSQIPVSDRINFQGSCVLHLLDLIGEIITNPDNLHPGDVIEEMLLGIPRKNNSEYGDLLGLELKSFSGGADLTLGSYSIVKLLKQHFGLKDMWDVVYCPSHINHADMIPTTHLIKANEGIRAGKKTYFDKLKLEIEGERVTWYLRRFNDPQLNALAGNHGIEWAEFDSRPTNEAFKKFAEGVVLIDIIGKKNDPYFVIENVFYYPLGPSEIAGLYNEGIVRYEARYAFKDKREVDDGRMLYHGRTARNTGHAFRISKSNVKRHMLTDEYRICGAADFIPEPIW